MEKKEANMNKPKEIIDQIEALRSKNNINWMNLVRLAFAVAPEEASNIMADICKVDGEIMNEARKLT